MQIFVSTSRNLPPQLKNLPYLPRIPHLTPEIYLLPKKFTSPLKDLPPPQKNSSFTNNNLPCTLKNLLLQIKKWPIAQKFAFSKYKLVFYTQKFVFPISYSEILFCHPLGMSCENETKFSVQPLQIDSCIIVGPPPPNCPNLAPCDFLCINLFKENVFIFKELLLL